MVLETIPVREPGITAVIRTPDGQVAVIRRWEVWMTGGHVLVGSTERDLAILLAKGTRTNTTNYLIYYPTNAVSLGKVLLQTVTVLEALDARRAHSVRAVVGSNFRDPTSKNVPIFPILYHLDTSVGNALQAHCSCTLR